MKIPDYISLFALFIALFSFLYTAWYNRQTVKKSKKLELLLNKPLLTVSYVIDENIALFELNIENNGIGPAIIDEISYEFMGTKTKDLLTLLKSYDYFKLPSLVDSDDSYRFYKERQVSYNKGHALALGSKNILFHLEVIFPKDKINGKHVVQFLCENVIVHLCFLDIFGNKTYKIERLQNV